MNKGFSLNKFGSTQFYTLIHVVFFIYLKNILSVLISSLNLV